MVLKHVTGGAEKINAVNYLAKPPLTSDECYYAEDTYALNEQMGGFRPSAQGSNKDNWRQGKVGTMVTTTVRVIISEMETTTATTTSTGVTTVTEMIGVGPMSLL